MRNKRPSQTTWIFLLISSTFCSISVTKSQIIGSSVVTSVSVIHQDDATTSSPNPSPSQNSRIDGQQNHDAIMSNKVLATLKSIVEEEKQKHNNKKDNMMNSRPSSTTSDGSIQSVDESPPMQNVNEPSISPLEDDENDENDFIVVTLLPAGQASGYSAAAGGSGNSPSPTTTITEIPTIISIDNNNMGSMKDMKDDNETATSAEVHQAIHKISGALLSQPGKIAGSTTIEHIVNNVLSSINEGRNSTSTTTTTTTSASSNAESMNNRPTMRPKISPPTTIQGDLEMITSRASTTTTIISDMFNSPEIGNGIGGGNSNKKKIGSGGMMMDDNVTSEKDTEEDEGEIKDDFTTVKPFKRPGSSKPRPTKVPIHYSGSNNNGNKKNNKKNATTSSNRPGDFYDDEIFGYDPYQTFLHGVYVPIHVENPNDQNNMMGNKVMIQTTNGLTTTCKPSDQIMVSPQQRPVQQHQQQQQIIPPHLQANRISVKSQISQNGKPIPTLPDYMIRPRPDHLEYQHHTADSVDPETGLLTQRPIADKFAQPIEDYNLSPDRFAAIPRPIIPKITVQNYSSHHHEAVHGGGHHHGGGHGHDGHGSGGDHPHEHGEHGHHGHHAHHAGQQNEKRPTFDPAPTGNPGLEATVTNVDPEMKSFVDINNRLALRFFSSVTNPVSKSSTSYNNMVISPFTIVSSLAMLFLGARGSTAGQIDSLLQLDDHQGFNPHMLHHNITQSFLTQPNTASALVRLLIADKKKGDVLDFFKTRVQHFYDARVEEADYKFAGHLAQSIINQMIRAQIQRHSYEMLNHSLPLTGPMSLLTAAFFDGQFSGVRDNTVEDMHFIHLAALGRRLIRVPAVSFKGPMRAVYDSELDATGIEIPYSTRELSLILLMPGKPGQFATGGVTSLKSRLTIESWTALMRGFFPRSPFKVVFPRFRHQTTCNMTYTLQRFGLTDMFSSQLAKFKGINGLTDLYLDQSLMHFSEFGTWEKLSDNSQSLETDSSAPQHINYKNLDLIRILRPHVRDHFNYGHFNEHQHQPASMSVNDWIFMSRNPAPTAAPTAQYHPPLSSSMITASNPFLSGFYHNNQQYHHQPLLNSYARVRSSKTPQSQLQSQSQEVPIGYFNKPTEVMSARRLLSKKYLVLPQVQGRKAQQSSSPSPPPSTTSTPPDAEETVLKFERPFLYILRHNPTGMILTTGQYTEPVTEEQI